MLKPQHIVSLFLAFSTTIPLTRGPKPSLIEAPNSSVTKVSNLGPGEYVYKLEVVDANNLTSSDNVSIIVTQSKPFCSSWFRKVGSNQLIFFAEMKEQLILSWNESWMLGFGDICIACHFFICELSLWP